MNRRGFEITVDVLTNSVNAGPVLADDLVTVAHDSSNNSIDVLSNDGDPDANPLVITRVGSLGLNQGSIGINGQRSKIVYSPATGFVGTESYVYTASDGAMEASASLSIQAQGHKIFLPLVANGL